jgi:hypothetical protein
MVYFLFILNPLSSFSQKLECMKMKQKSIQTVFAVLPKQRAAPVDTLCC